MSRLHTWSAIALSRAYRQRSLSPVEVTQAVIEQILRCEPQLCASWLFRPELALQQARESQLRWQRGEPLSDLDGVPVTLKDNIATAGDAMPLGTAAMAHTPMPADSPPAARLREAGAVRVAKTTMPDYGMLSSGVSSFHKTARNPWDIRRTPGGSSAGAGAAAAAAYGPLHLGTDIGGSIRLPAGWCGVFGLKPSLGRIPIDPPYTGRAAGPMTRSAADAAFMMRWLSLPDVRDAMSLPPQDIAWHEVADADATLGADAARWLHGKRFGLLLDAGCGLPVEPEVRLTVERAARAIELAGGIVEPMQPFLTPSMLAGLDHFWRMRSHLDLKALPPEREAQVLPYIRDWAHSAQGMAGEALFAAQHQIYLTRMATVRATAAFDYVLSPVSPLPAFDAELPSPTNDPMRPLEHIAFTVPFNMSEQPAASVNCGYTSGGLPIGLQIAGARFDDLGVLRMAHAFEQIREPQRPWPLD